SLSAVGLGYAGAVAALLLRTRRPAAARVVTAATTIGAAAVLLSSLGRSASWRLALDYRSWVVPLTLPLLGVLGVSARQVTGRRGGVAAWVGAGTFSLVLCMQGVAWSSQRHAYDVRVAGTSVRCERYEDLLPPPGTALHHWATPAMVLLDQGAHPRHLLLI